MALQLVLFLSLVLFVASNTPPRHRDISVNVVKQRLQFRASYQDRHYHDSFTFNMNLARARDQILRGYFEYVTQGRTTNQTQLQFDFTVQRLLEINTTREEYYKGDESSIVSYWPKVSSGIDFANWKDESLLINGTRVYRYSATTTDGTFTIRVSISNRVERVIGVPIGPNDVKMDFLVNRFPYLNRTTRVALETHIKSKTKSMSSPSSSILSNSVVFTGRSGFPFGLFSWADKANTTTEQVDVMAWSPQTIIEDHYDIFFTFMTTVPQPTFLIWDPRIGLDYIKGEEFCIGRVCGVGAYFVIVAIIVAALLLVTLVAIAISRRRSGYDSLRDSPSSPTYVS